MCGRLNVTDDPVVQWICDYLGISFEVTENTDLRPSQMVASITGNGELRQLNASWGIQPSWSKNLLINAQSESVATKKTFRAAFSKNRCLIPCTGWYEWRDEGGARKQKYAFTHAKRIPFLMAGVLFEHVNWPQLLTLTCQPNRQCAQIHNRMPLLLQPEAVDFWLNATAEQVQSIMQPLDGDIITIQKC